MINPAFKVSNLKSMVGCFHEKAKSLAKVCKIFTIFPSYYPRANGAKRRSGRKPGARVTNSARLFTPGEKDSIADSKVVVIVGWVVISLISKKWMFIRSGRGKIYKK